MALQKEREEAKLTAKRKPRKNLVGKRFHRLTVTSFDRFSDAGYPYWNCVCDCGKEQSVYEHNLVSGRTKSCGCLKSERGKRLWQETLHSVDGVQLEATIAQTTKKNNTSGFRGVSWVERVQKWRVSITFRGSRYHLGYFEDFNDAVCARLEGEQIVTDFVNAYFDSVSGQIGNEKLKKLKYAFENNIRAKEKSETEFKRHICGQ